MIQAGLLLLAFNLLFAVLVWLAMYFPGLDLAASVACGYFLFRWIRGLSRVGVSVWQAAGISFISQLPGLILGGLALVSWYLYGPLTSNFDFMLQMWHTHSLRQLCELFVALMVNGPSRAFGGHLP